MMKHLPLQATQGQPVIPMDRKIEDQQQRRVIPVIPMGPEILQDQQVLMTVQMLVPDRRPGIIPRL